MFLKSFGNAPYVRFGEISASPFQAPYTVHGVSRLAVDMRVRGTYHTVILTGVILGIADNRYDGSTCLFDYFDVKVSSSEDFPKFTS